MVGSRRFAFWSAGSLVFCGLMAAGLAGGRPERERDPLERNRQVNPTPSSGPANIVRQGFPAARSDPSDLSKSDTAWEIDWDFTSPDNNNKPRRPSSVFRIRSAKFMCKDKNNQPRWLTVARNVEMAEAFSPYNDGSTAFLDIFSFSFKTLPARKEYLGPACVAPGEILESANPHYSKLVYKEVHDDGIRWKTGFYPKSPDRARRGEKMILWSLFQAANYSYMVEYVFTDDGRIVCRLGFTGHNFYDRDKRNMKNDGPGGDVHLHIPCWRMEFDLAAPGSGLGGPTANHLLLVRRAVNKATGRFYQQETPFGIDREQNDNLAREGKDVWRPEEFTMLRAQSGVLKNSHGRPIAYDLIPTRLGSVRNLLPTGQAKASSANMEFANYDFWVTRTEGSHTNFFEVPRYAQQKRPLAGFPATVWYSTPALHVPRGEDFGDNGFSNGQGVALTAWAEFTLRPRDLFDGTPLYRP